MISNVRAKIREGKSLDEALDFMRESLVIFENERAVAAVKWIDENRKYFSELPYGKWGQNGQAFYEELTDVLNHNPEKASKLLRESGIAGIRYLDGNSRGSGKGSYNYVVFDDADVSVQETFYQQEQVNSNPVSIDTRILGDFNIKDNDSMLSLKKKSLDWYREHLQTLDKDRKRKNEPAYNPVLGEVYFSKRGGNESTFIRRNKMKLFLIPYLKEIIASGRVLYSDEKSVDFVVKADKKKSGEKDILAYNYIDNTVSIQMPDEMEGALYNVRLSIEKHIDGHWHYDIGKLEAVSKEEDSSGSYGLGSQELNSRATEESSSNIIAHNSQNDSQDNFQMHQISKKMHRGSITFPVAEKQPIHISLGENANRSTFVHELGHFYLWNLKRLAAMDITANRPMSYSNPLVKDVDGKPVEVGENTLTHVARWNDDLQAIAGWWSDNAAELARQSARYGENLKLSEGGFRDWIARGMERDSEADAAYYRAAQEYFARGFEAYLTEGEAPSKELLGVFRRFKAWMTEIYKSVTELEVELSPEIRRVFDCMVATDAINKIINIVKSANSKHGHGIMGGVRVGLRI